MFYKNTPNELSVKDLANIPKIHPSLDDEEVEITNKYHHRPDIMAKDIYGSSKYWFVFLLRNMDVIEDPIFDHERGKKIMVPHPNSVKRL